MADANEYGKALLMLAGETGDEEKVLAELSDVKRIIIENPKYTDLADTPAVPSAERIGLVEEAFKGVDGNVLNLLKMLCEKREFYKIPAIADSYSKLFDEHAGRLRVTAVTAVPLTDAQATALKEKLEKKTGKTVIIENKVDPAVLGGVKLRYAGVQLDGTLRANLLAMEKKLADLKI